MQFDFKSLLGFRLKLSLLVIAIVMATLAAIVWKSREVLTDDRLSFLADSAMKQIAPLKRLVQNRLDEQRADLVRLATAHTPAQASRGRGLGEYEVLALMESAGGPQWKPTWSEKSEQAKAGNWPSGYDLTLLSSLPYARIRDGETIWARVSDPKGLPVYAVLVSVEIQNSLPGSQTAINALPDSTDYQSASPGTGRKAVVVGLSSINPLTDVTEEYIGSSNAVFLVDDKGYVASHVNKSYLGALLSEDPIVHEIVTTKKTAASGRFEDLESRAVLGHFERIDRTNLYAVITTPLKPVGEFLSSYMQTLWTIGALGCAIGLIAVWVLSSMLSPSAKPLSPAPAETGQNPAPAGAQPRPAAARKEENFVLQSTPGRDLNVNPKSVPMPREFSVGFAKAVKEPLMAILGHAQLVKIKTEPSEMKAHAESIEREARRATEIIAKLDDCAGAVEELPLSVALNLKEVIEKFIEEKSAVFKTDGIVISQNLAAVPELRGSVEQLKTVLHNLVENSLEAMKKRPKKTLSFDLSYDGKNIYLTVGDSGVGMTRDVQTRAFEPFFKGFDSPAHAGMGLTFAQIAIRRFGGSCEIASSPGEGAKFKMKFPVGELEKRDFEARATSDLAEVVGGHFKPDLKSSTSPDEISLVTLAGGLPPTSPQAAEKTTAQVIASNPTLEVALKHFDLDLDVKDDDPENDGGESQNGGDDDESFASIDLGKFMAQPPVAGSPSENAAPPEKKSEFKVSIRRPRVRS